MGSLYSTRLVSLDVVTDPPPFTAGALGYRFTLDLLSCTNKFLGFQLGIPCGVDLLLFATISNCV